MNLQCGNESTERDTFAISSMCLVRQKKKKKTFHVMLKTKVKATIDIKYFHPVKSVSQRGWGVLLY